MIEQNLLLILVTLPFLGALVAASLPVNAHNAAAAVSGLVLAGALAILAALHPAIAEGQVLRASLDWVPSLGLGLDIRLDGFAWMFVTLVAAIGGLVVIYARYYLSKSDPVPRFYSFLMAFTGAMMGMLLSGNILPARGLLGADLDPVLPSWSATGTRRPQRATGRGRRSS